ncbi:MAG: ABC transporter permease subunit [Clostridia bacterium]|nr:ABC transporter permease subunit [Clostridia bacterium]
MKMPFKTGTNAILRFGMERRIKRISTLVMILVIISVIGFILMTVLGTSSLLFGSSTGTAWYIALSAMEFIAIAVNAASNCASEIAGEKARQTLDLLICSQMTPKSIIRGKLLSNFLFSLLIVAVMLPFYAVIYLFGGFTPISVVEFILYMLNWVFCVSATGIFFSSVIKKSAPATVLTIAFWAAFIIADGLFALLWEGVKEYLNYSLGIAFANTFDYPPILWINPVTGFVMLFLLQIAGFSGVASSTTAEIVQVVAPIILGVVLPVIISIVSVKLAERAIDPMRSRKNSGGI